MNKIKKIGWITINNKEILVIGNCQENKVSIFCFKGECRNQFERNIDRYGK